MAVTLFGKTFQGVIFDMDGTMVNNMMAHHRAWQRKLAELGLELSMEEVHERIHGVNEEILERLFGDRFTAADRKRIAAEKEAAYREVFKEELQLLSGLEDFLEYLFEEEVPMAIGTAAPAENVDFVLDELDLRRYFGAIRHAGDVTRGKPDPQVFELAAEGIDVPVQQCLIFEDSPTGAEASERAGAACVVLTTTHQPSEFEARTNILHFMEDFSGLPSV
jgi:HAD superfamily hydrolase (TIGR01509 family)